MPIKGRGATQKEMFRDVMVIVLLIIAIFVLARFLGFL